MEQLNGVIVRKIFNPLQGDFDENYYEMDFIERGGVEVFYENGRKILKPKTYLLVRSEPSLIIKSVSVKEGLSMLQLRIHKELFPSKLLNLKEMHHVRPLFASIDDGLYGNNSEIYHQLYEWAEQCADYNDEMVVPIIYNILYTLSVKKNYKIFPSKRLVPIDFNLPEDSVIRKINDFMAAHVSKPLSLADVAKIAGLTVTSLCRFYKKKTGYSPLVYMNQLRLRKALELLEKTDMTVKEIVYQCGYSDPNFFFKFFKREMGMTPLEYRQRNL